jgi:hypothetical protein
VERYAHSGKSRHHVLGAKPEPEKPRDHVGDVRLPEIMPGSWKVGDDLLPARDRAPPGPSESAEELHSKSIGPLEENREPRIEAAVGTPAAHPNQPLIPSNRFGLTLEPLEERGNLGGVHRRRRGKRLGRSGSAGAPGEKQREE